MTCPECGISFRGGKFYSFGKDGLETMRKCPNGHHFKEPPRKRSKSDFIRSASMDMYEALTDALKVAEFEHHAYRPWHDLAKQALAKADGKQ